MTRIAQCAAPTEVRQNIDRLDRQPVVLIAERGACVRPAASGKKRAEAVAPLHPPSPPAN